MNVPVPIQATGIRGAPACFGKEWSNTEAECTGGPDYSFKDEEGKHVRPRCGYFSTCGSITAASRQVIPPQSLIRPQLPVPQQPLPTFAPQPPTQPQPAQPAGMPPRPVWTPPVWTPPVMHPPVAPPSQMTDWRTIEQQRQAGLAARQQDLRAFPAPAYLGQVQPMQIAPPAVHYQAQTWQVGNAMPAYLTHEEERQPGESWFVALAFSILRGMLKAFGHSFARYVDITPFRGPPRS